MARLLKTDGEARDTEVKTFHQLQALVGGYVCIVYRDEYRVLVGNADGGPLDLPLNEQATEIAGFTIVGDVVTLSTAEARKVMG